MDPWITLLIAIATAAATTLIAETVRAIRESAAARKRVAGWGIRVLPGVRGLRGRFFVIENIGDDDAFDVHVTIGGDASYEVNAGAPLDLLRPRDTFLLLITDPGSASVLITWKDGKGKGRGPARRALTPE